jgi:sodium/hydrogen antiporter
MLIVQVIHGLTIPMSKLGFWLPRTISRAVSTAVDENQQSFQVRGTAIQATDAVENQPQRRAVRSSANGEMVRSREVLQIGRSVIAGEARP